MGGDDAGGALDPGPVRRLADALGAAGVGELLDIFATDGPATLAELRAALQSGRLSDAARAAHTLKSHAATFGAARLAAACREVEARAGAGDAAGAAAGLPEVVREFDPAADALRALADRLA
jgi:HPt (histidine-containing phosphotransfer) domain-containing protein